MKEIPHDPRQPPNGPLFKEGKGVTHAELLRQLEDVKRQEEYAKESYRNSKGSCDSEGMAEASHSVAFYQGQRILLCVLLKLSEGRK